VRRGNGAVTPLLLKGKRAASTHAHTDTHTRTHTHTPPPPRTCCRISLHCSSRIAACDLTTSHAALNCVSTFRCAAGSAKTAFCRVVRSDCTSSAVSRTDGIWSRGSCARAASMRREAAMKLASMWSAWWEGWGWGCVALVEGSVGWRLGGGGSSWLVEA